ncbi:hypothetical protein [Fodinibius saliphilus]|uniref:hypothetical protein n=1 Tax=Fodinibius saliphilus TaxID=1920650 RepID=UPI0011097621|nr:hypothetical protein [Fodinibius saliphilus]
MDTLQKGIITLGIILILASGLFLPWNYTFNTKGNSEVTKPAGYHLAMDPPEPERNHPYYGVEVDTERFWAQSFVIIIFFGGLAYISGKRTEE